MLRHFSKIITIKREVGIVISTFSFIRVFNLFKLLVGFFLSRLLRFPVVFGKPLAVSIEPTNYCNLQCPECPVGADVLKRSRGCVSVEQFESMLRQFGDALWILNLYFQGEPFLHPQFLELVKLANRYGLYTMTSTNAHFLSDEKAQEVVLSGLHKLVVSVDGTNQVSYGKYRVGGRLDKVLDGVRNVLEVKRRLNSVYPIVEVQFLVFKHNEEEISDMRQLCAGLGVDVLSFKSAQFNDFGNSEVQPPVNEKYSRYKTASEGGLRLKGKAYGHCWRQWSSCVVSWDGKVLPCCFDKDADYQLGNLRNETMPAVWKGRWANGFRKMILRNRASCDICNNCSERGAFWF